MSGRPWLIPALLVLAVLALAAVGCGGDDDGEDSDQAETVQTATVDGDETVPTGAEASGAAAAAVVDQAGAQNEQQFCIQYNAVVAGGGTEEQAFRGFEQGYGTAQPVPAREVFDEYVSRC